MRGKPNFDFDCFFCQTIKSKPRPKFSFFYINPFLVRKKTKLQHHLSLFEIGSYLFKTFEFVIIVHFLYGFTVGKYAVNKMKKFAQKSRCLAELMFIFRSFFLQTIKSKPRPKFSFSYINLNLGRRNTKHSTNNLI